MNFFMKIDHFLDFTNCFISTTYARILNFILVVKEKVPGLEILWIFNPEDIKTLFANEGSIPARRSHLALEKYRKDKPDLYR